MAYTTLTATWLGTGGGTGYSRMHWLGNLTTAEITQQLNAMKTFFGALVSYLPAAVSIRYSGLAQEYDNAGILKSELSVAPPADTLGSGGAVWSAPNGGVMSWNTGAFNAAGHRIRGRTYLVPLASTAFTNNGGILGTANTTITGAGTNLVTGLIPMVVVSKTPDGHYVGVTNVTAAAMSQKSAVLTSRRD